MQPLLAAAEFATIIMFVLMGIGWVIQQLTTNNKQDVPPVPRPRPRPKNQDRLQDEIDIFINDVKRQVPQERANRPAPPPPPKPRKPQAAPTQNQPKRVAPQPVATASQPSGSRLGSSVASRHLNSNTDLGSEVRDHKQKHLRSGDIDASVRRHLGAGTTQIEDVHPTDAAMQIRTLLQSQLAVKQAIIINELLAKPLALRR